MRRYLVVANRTLGGEHLTGKVQRCLEEGPCSFYVLVPATMPPDHFTATEAAARTAGTARLEDALARFRDMGAADVDGEVGDHRAIDAVGDVLRHREFDEIIISTFPVGVSRWLKQDLPHRVERLSHLPVTHIVADREPAHA